MNNEQRARRDELADALRGHKAEIVEADEWRPLADHVLALLDQVEQPLLAKIAELEECAKESADIMRRSRERSDAVWNAAVEACVKPFAGDDDRLWHGDDVMRAIRALCRQEGE